MEMGKMILFCEIKLKLGDAWTAYDRMVTADALLKKIKSLVNQDCEKSKGAIGVLSVQGEIDRENKEVFGFGRDVGR
jgi:hypothetical protein